MTNTFGSQDATAVTDDVPMRRNGSTQQVRVRRRTSGTQRCLATIDAMMFELTSRACSVLAAYYCDAKQNSAKSVHPYAIKYDMHRALKKQLCSGVYLVGQKCIIN